MKAKSLKKMAPVHGAEPDICHIRDLVADPQNRRKHNPRNIGMVVDALQQVGAARSIVIDEDNVVLAGNGVSEAAMEAGITRVQVVEVDGSTLVAVRRTGLSEAQKRALALFDNRTGELAEWNADQLAADVAAGLDLKPWFSDEELAAVLGTKLEPKAGLTDPDDVPAVRATDIQAGDLFELGKHRLLCGDSTTVGDVARLMGGELARVVFTDPPYGVNYTGGTTKRRGLDGDHRGTEIYGDALPMVLLASEEKAALYLWHAGAVSMPVLVALSDAGYEVRSQIIWNKNMAQFGALGAQYKQKHEPCFYAYRKGVAPYWYGPNNEVTVWDISRSQKNEFHPTQKPVELAERALANSSAVGDVVLDLFSGSGSTMIACESQGRHATVMEIDPSYCQVAIDRWEAFTGQKAQKVGEAVRV